MEENKIDKNDLHLERKLIAERYLKGKGIEIGALTTPLELPKSAKVEYVDMMSEQDLRNSYPELKQQNFVNADIIDDGERLTSIQDSTQDFVVANHFLEHCENPILALRNMLRVLKKGGTLYLALPDKRYTFDFERPVTPLKHIIRDYQEGPGWSRHSHLEEWIRLVKKIADENEATKFSN